MPALTLARDYLLWHYSSAYIDILHIWWNYLWFINHLFAVPDVIMNWVAPFKRLQEAKVNIMKSPSDFFANLVVNLIMRIVGFVIRTALIGMSLVGFVFIFLLGISLLIAWTILPMLIVHFFISGIQSFVS